MAKLIEKSNVKKIDFVKPISEKKIFKCCNIKWNVLVICLIAVFIVAYIGSLFTREATKSDWYQQIKPSLTPPNWVFPVVWNILFFLIALSLYFAWINANDKQKSKIVLVFGINFLLNVLWSMLYFYLRNVQQAFYEIILIFISIILMMLTVRKINKTSLYLLIPYLLWVGFASVLNYLSI